MSRRAAEDGTKQVARRLGPRVFGAGDHQYRFRILDRRAAIRLAIGMAMPGDVVLLAGKGHEDYQIIGTTKHHFDDVEEATNAIRSRVNVR